MRSSQEQGFQIFKKKLLFTIGLLFICRIGSYIPVPGIDASLFEKFFSNSGQSIFTLLNTLSGGALGRLSIFTLSIVPFITASIVMQLLTMTIEGLNNLKKEGESGRKKIVSYTRYLALALSIFQSSVIAFSLNNIEGVEPLSLFAFSVVVISLTSGVIFLMWISDLITLKGIGNGTSLIIFVNIISSLPTGFITFLNLVKSGALSPFAFLGFLALVILTFVIVVFFEKSFRKVTIHYSRGNTKFSLHQKAEPIHLPIKLNISGVIPPIFASSLLLFPYSILSLSTVNPDSWLSAIMPYFSHGSFTYVLLYSALIFFFSFFYATTLFNTEQTADNLKKHGAFIPGIRPGKATSDYLTSIINKITFLGASYICFVCVVPELFFIESASSLFLGGTSILILVNVVIDTIAKAQNYFLSSKYNNLVGKIKIRNA